MKKLILGSIIFFSVTIIPSSAYAQVPFGGLEVSIFPCTCSAQFLHYFAPLWLGPVPATGALTYPMGATTAFLFGILKPGSWALGTYTPGVQACWVWAGKFCFPIPSLGAITPFTGTSL
ncbi:MAG: hypothetical protein AAB555_01545 [Patescibacteria group bacterium]